MSDVSEASHSSKMSHSPNYITINARRLCTLRSHCHKNFQSYVTNNSCIRLTSVSNLLSVRFEVSTAVTMMIIIFWEMTPCVSYESVPIQELTTSLCNLLALVHPEDGGDTILRNAGSYKSHTVSSPRR
jgi:hypothetical protein